MVQRRIRALNEAVARSPSPLELMPVLVELSQFKSIEELDLAILNRIPTEPNANIRLALAQGNNAHFASTPEMLRLALQAFDGAAPPPPGEPDGHNGFLGSLSNYVYQLRGQNQLRAGARTAVVNHFIAIVNGGKAEAIDRWLQYFGRDPEIAHEAFQRFSDISAVASPKMKHYLLSQLPHWSGNRGADLPELRTTIMGGFAGTFVSGTSAERIALLKPLQSWRPPVEFRPLLRQVAFDRGQPVEVREEARKALFWSYLGYIPPSGARDAAFHEFDQKRQAFRNLWAGTRVRRDSVCAWAKLVFE